MKQCNSSVIVLARVYVYMYIFRASRIIVHSHPKREEWSLPLSSFLSCLIPKCDRVCIERLARVRLSALLAPSRGNGTVRPRADNSLLNTAGKNGCPSVTTHTIPPRCLLEYGPS